VQFTTFLYVLCQVRSSVLTIRWDSQGRTSGLVLTVRPCSRGVLVWRNGSARWRTSLSSPSCSTKNSRSFPSPSECVLHTNRGKEDDGINKGGAQTDQPDTQLFSLYFLPFSHYSGLCLQTNSPMASTSWCLDSVGTKPALCFGTSGVEPRYGRILYILLSSQFLQSSIGVQR